MSSRDFGSTTESSNEVTARKPLSSKFAGRRELKRRALAVEGVMAVVLAGRVSMLAKAQTSRHATVATAAAPIHTLRWFLRTRRFLRTLKSLDCFVVD